MTLSLARPAEAPHDHVVNLYDDFADVVPDVVAFLADGLQDGEVAIVVASRAHRELFDRELGEHLDLDLARSAGRYLSLDAQETMARFRVGGRIDRCAFRSVVGELVGSTAAGRPVRAFGEMVALLWEAGDRWGAIELEGLWNELAQVHRFSLCCAYPMASLTRAGDLSAIHAVCSSHSLVTLPGSYRADLDEMPATFEADRSEVFIADTLAVRAVRRFVVRALADLDDAVGGTAALVASELAANVVEHVGSPFRVTVRRSNGIVTLAVEDLSPDEPVRVDAAIDSVTGRGFRIIDALCSRWGTDVGPNGKVVWAEIMPE